MVVTRPHCRNKSLICVTARTLSLFSFQTSFSLSSTFHQPVSNKESHNGCGWHSFLIHTDRIYNKTPMTRPEHTTGGSTKLWSAFTSHWLLSTLYNALCLWVSEVTFTFRFHGHQHFTDTTWLRLWWSGAPHFVSMAKT